MERQPRKRKPNRLSHHCHKEAVHNQRHCHISMIEPLMKRPARLSHANPTRTPSAVVMMKKFKPKWNRNVVRNNPQSAITGTGACA